MTDKQIMQGGRGSAKPFTTLNSIKLMLEIDQLKAENKRLDNELYMTVEEGRAWYDLMERYEQALTEIKNIVETCNSGINCSECPYTKECKTDTEAEALGVCKLIQQKCEVLNE